MGQNWVSTTVPHFTWVDASNSRKMKLTEPILTNSIHPLKEGFEKEFRNYGQTLEAGFLLISGYMRIQATCSSMSLIYRMIFKKSKATLIPNYEGIGMLENRI